MKKYVKTFVSAFLVCEFIELLYNFFYKENLQQIIVGIITSCLIAVFISISINYINSKKKKK